MEGIAELTLVAREAAGADLLVIGAFQGEAPHVDGLPAAVAAAGRRAGGRRGFTGRDDQVAETDAGDGQPVVLLRGLGQRGELTAPKLARWLTAVAEDAATAGFPRYGVVFPDHPEIDGPGAPARVLRALSLGGYSYDSFRSDAADGVHIQAVEVVPPPGSEDAYREALSASRAVAEAVAFCRSIANTPANLASPAFMEAQARELADSRGFRVTVLDAAELERRGMGGILAVGAGSAHPPRMVKLTWGSEGPRVALVGKGVTFDSGGISIKPATDMDQMKFDKCGACTVLAVARAVADLALPIHLSVYVPLAENMLSGQSYRPGDILRCYNGKTVEITNTDAEGRLILADALSWAVEEGAEVALEFSTLTGACVVALGSHAAGLFSPDEALAGELAAASAATGERLWRLPLYPEFVEEMKGNHADLQNSSGRWGGASTAAAFLSQFVGDLKRWAHLDIAGVAYQSSEKHRHGANATGFGVATTVEWLRRLSA
jgi:leucyl aminopeptidase